MAHAVSESVNRGTMEDQSIDEEEEQLDASESQTDGNVRKAVKKRRTTSKAEYWVGYDIYEDSDGNRRAKCKYCKDKNYACDSNKVGNKNVRNHFLKCPENPEFDEKMTRGNPDLDDISNRSEFDLYLHERYEGKDCDVLKWWRINEPRYPILSRMARDVLAIPITTVPSESAFSTGGRHLTPYRSRLSPTMVQALVCTQDWLRSRTNSKNNKDSNDVDDDDVEDMDVEGTFYA